MNEHNFVRRIHTFPTGDHFLAEKEIPLATLRASDGLAIGAVASGTVNAASTSTAEALSLTFNAPTLVPDGISFDDGETALIQFVVPQDFAKNVDNAALRLIVKPSADAAHTTDIGITTAQSIFRAGSAEDATVSTAVAEDAVASTGALVREVILNISERAFEPGDVIQLTLDVNNSGTTELILVGAALIYGSTLRAYNDDDNERDLTV